MKRPKSVLSLLDEISAQRKLTGDETRLVFIVAHFFLPMANRGCEFSNQVLDLLTATNEKVTAAVSEFLQKSISIRPASA